MKYYIRQPDLYNSNTSLVRIYNRHYKEYFVDGIWKRMHPNITMLGYKEVSEQDIFLELL